MKILKNKMNFIPGHAIFIEKAIDPNLLKILVEKWNYYEIEKNANMIEYIWKILFPLIPKECEGKKLVGYDISSISLNKKIVTKKDETPEKTFERQKRGKGSKSLLTISIICNTNEDFFRFYDNKNSNIKFIVPNADFFTVQHVAGNVILYTNKVSFSSIQTTPSTPSTSSNPSYCLKIPVYYSNGIPKTFEIPTPNGEKFNKVEFVDVYGNLVTLTPDLNNPHSKERWDDIERRSKILKIQKYLLPSYINTKKGRPPTKNEDYCPNCYEIISLTENYTNCSGCLSPIDL
jgi:hypothetical protein